MGGGGREAEDAEEAEGGDLRIFAQCMWGLTPRVVVEVEEETGSEGLVQVDAREMGRERERERWGEREGEREGNGRREREREREGEKRSGEERELDRKEENERERQQEREKQTEREREREKEKEREREKNEQMLHCKARKRVLALALCQQISLIRQVFVSLRSYAARHRQLARVLFLTLKLSRQLALRRMCAAWRSIARLRRLFRHMVSNSQRQTKTACLRRLLRAWQTASWKMVRERGMVEAVMARHNRSFHAAIWRSWSRFCALSVDIRRGCLEENMRKRHLLRDVVRYFKSALIAARAAADAASMMQKDRELQFAAATLHDWVREATLAKDQRAQQNVEAFAREQRCSRAASFAAERERRSLKGTLTSWSAVAAWADAKKSLAQRVASLQMLVSIKDGAICRRALLHWGAEAALASRWAAVAKRHKREMEISLVRGSLGRWTLANRKQRGMITKEKRIAERQRRSGRVRVLQAWRTHTTREQLLHDISHRVAARAAKRALATWHHAAAAQRRASLTLADMLQRQRGAAAGMVLEAWRELTRLHIFFSHKLVARVARARGRCRLKVLLAWRANVVLGGLVWRQQQAIAVAALRSVVLAWVQEVRLSRGRDRSMSSLLRRRFEHILARAVKQWACACRHKQQCRHTQRILDTRVRSKLAWNTLHGVHLAWAWHSQRHRRMHALANMLLARRRIISLTRAIVCLRDYSVHVLGRRGRQARIGSVLGLTRERRMLEGALVQWQRSQAASLATAVTEKGLQSFISTCLRVTLVRPNLRTWQQLTQRRVRQRVLGEEHLRRVAAGAKLSFSRSLMSRGFETWKKQHLIESFFESQPLRRLRKLLKAWRHRVLLIVAQRDRRVQRMHVARRSSVLCRIANLWRKHMVCVRQRVMLAERLHYSSKRRQRDCLLSASLNAFSLCLVLHSSFPFIPAPGRRQRGGEHGAVEIPEGTGRMPATQQETWRQGQAAEEEEKVAEEEGPDGGEEMLLDERERCMSQCEMRTHAPTSSSYALRTGAGTAAADVRYASALVSAGLFCSLVNLFCL
jgi:hypothetical protein